MKSFNIHFDIHGNVKVDNIKGVVSDECLFLTWPYESVLNNGTSEKIMLDTTIIQTENADPETI
jgi:hypothetical protein